MLSSATDNDFASCYGCGLCTLVCPLWHQGGDVSRTPQGYARTMQAGGDANRDAAFDCLLCGACDVVCPQNIDTVDLVLALRRGEQLDISNRHELKPISTETKSSRVFCNGREEALLIAETALAQRCDARGKNLLQHIMAQLNQRCCITQAGDNGDDIAAVLQRGETLDPTRLEAFLQPLRGASKLIVSDGLLKRALHQWLPRCDIVSLGFALSNLVAVREQLTADDLYLIEPRAYHADFARLVDHYDGLGRESGCKLNFDLQRLAIPSGANPHQPREQHGRFDASKQAQWLMQGREVARIVVESLGDLALMTTTTQLPVIHIAELAASGGETECKV